MIVITMFFSGGLIPRFMVVRALGMYDSYLALTVPIAISAFNLIVMRTFFKQVPEELEESELDRIATAGDDVESHPGWLLRGRG